MNQTWTTDHARSRTPKPEFDSLSIPAVLLLTALALTVGAGLIWLMTGPNANAAFALLSMFTQGVILILNPLLGFLVWLVTAPFVPYVGFGIDLPDTGGLKPPNPTSTRVGFVVLLLILLLGAATGRRKLAAFNRIDLLMLLFGAALLLSVRTALLGVVHSIQAIYDSYFLAFFAYFFARNLIRNRTALNRLIDALLLIGIYLTFFALQELITGQPLLYDPRSVTYYSESLIRIVSLLGNPAYLAFVLAMVMPFAIMRALEASSRARRIAYSGFAMLCFITIFFMYVRTGWGVGLLSVAILLPFYAKLRRVVLPMLGVLAVVGLLAWGPISRSTIVTERLEAQKPLDYRVNAANAAFEIWKESPIFGVGYQNFPWIALQRGYVADSQNFFIPTPHNAYLDVAVSAGLLGLLTFVGLILAIAGTLMGHLRQARKIPELAWTLPLLAALLSALCAYAVPGFTLDLAPAWFISLVFYTLLGGILGAIEGEKTVSAGDRRG